ncbi:MAG: hypothetical protein HOA30_19335 [Rhodospirillaceae bacterium]|nr:hypothetical protein [Rhodospirillaceae bacterium]MBT6886192.1 hypothetical protein [Rhodospirillaceae bacterium]MBT7250259.1 hypothetical protein [Rhodospirillaceae bacterium]
MKLTEAQITAVEEKTGAKPLPEEDDATKQMAEAFGEHTFYLDQNGLYIMEKSDEQGETGMLTVLVQLGEWADEEMTSLQAIDARITDMVINFVNEDEAV